MELAYSNDDGNNPEIGGGGQTLDRIIERGGYSKSELLQLLKPEVDKINAKYNTELDALEKQTPSGIKETIPNVEDWSRDVESTAKALEGKDVSDIDKKIEKVYHGTSYDIEKPTIEKYGQVHEMGGMLGKAVYYTPSVEEAKYFADLSKNKNKNGIKKVIEGVLNAKNIISVTDLVKNVKDEVLQKWITDNGKNYINPSDVKNRINIESNEKELTRWLSSIGDISELAKMNGNDAVTWGYENGKPNEIAIVDDNLVETNKAKYISEAYHKAKADGSNPELVAAVEDLLGKQKESSPTPQTGKGEREVKQQIETFGVPKQDVSQSR